MRGSLTHQRRVRRAGFVALLVCVLALSGCQFFWQSSSPQLPQGWSWYHDSAYPFDLPVPAGWQAFGYWTGITPGEHCYRTVDLIPVTEAQEYRSDPLRVFESISLSIPTYPADCELENVPTTPRWKLAGSTSLGGKTAALYLGVDNSLDNGADFDTRMVEASFGGRQYSLGFYDEKSSFEIPSQQYQRFDASQLAIFDIVRNDFTYHG